METATTLIPGDLIALNVSIPSDERTIRHVARLFNATGTEVTITGEIVAGGHQLNLSNGAAVEVPPFDRERFEQLLREGRRAEADAMASAYAEAFAEASKGGGLTTADRLQMAVYEFLKTQYGVSSEDHTGPVLGIDELVTRPPLRLTPTTPGTWTVQAAPKWGRR